MQFSTYRRSTAEDEAKAEAAAVRFCKRHNITLSDDDKATHAVFLHITSFNTRDDRAHAARLNRLWKYCLARAWNVPYSRNLAIGDGYVGYIVD